MRTLTGAARLPLRSLYVALSLLLLALALSSVRAALSSTSVAPQSLVAGDQGAVVVTLTSSVGISVDSFVVVQFPNGFVVDTAGAAVAVDAATYATTLSVAAVTATTITCQVATAAIASGVIFEFSISTIANPGAGSSGTFTITIQDSSSTVVDQDTTVQEVTIVSSALAGVSVTPDSVVGGESGALEVSFTSPVVLPVGSIISLTVPLEYALSSTSTVSSASNLDGTSSCLVDVVARTISVTVAVTAVSANVLVSFKVDGVTNPGAVVTSDFALQTLDSSNRVYASLTGIAGVTIVSTTLNASPVLLSTFEAGVAVVLNFPVTLARAIPGDGFVGVLFPVEYWFANAPSLSEVGGAFSASGALAHKHGQEVTFRVPLGIPPGTYTAQVSSLRNPGVTTTGAFEIRTADSAGRTIEVVSLAGITTLAGDLMTARMSPSNPHPGIAANVHLSFTTPAALVDDTLVYVALSTDDYSFAVANPTVSVHALAGATAAITWDAPNTAFAILLSSPVVIAEGTAINFTITALNMPPSIRIDSSATIQTWNALGLLLDGPSVLVIDAVTAVTNLPVQWTTSYPYPGITSPIVLTFDTNGALPAGGQIKLELPLSDFSATTYPVPNVTFHNPAMPTSAATWNPPARTLLLTSIAAIPAYSAVTLTISSLDTPATVRTSARSAFLSTFDAFGVLIDGPSEIILESIDAGPILGTRLWIPTRATPGVTSDQTVAFFTNGKLVVGSQLEFVLPDTHWAVTTAAIASFTHPSLGQVVTVVWDESTSTLTATLTGSTSIPAYTQVTMVLSGITTPPKETAVTIASVTTRGLDGNVIDGPGVISIGTIHRGVFHGAKTFQSSTTTSASMASKQVLTVTLSGGLPSGSMLSLAFPSPGWRAVSNTVGASMLQPSTGVSVASSSWDPDTRVIMITMHGDITEGTEVEIEIVGMINPYDVDSTAIATTLSLKSALADGGVVDESFDISINTITASDLGSSATWTSSVATPGVTSTQTLQVQTGGQLEAGSSICLSTPPGDSWIFLATTTATVSSASMAESAMDVEWTAASQVLCLKCPVPVPEASQLTIAIKNVRSPPSERAQATAVFTIHSHLGGLVNAGTIQLNAITRGALSGERKWQSAFFSPGPVASMSTTATLMFTTAGQIPPGGQVVLTLPIEWELNAATCAVQFVNPTVFGTASCLQNVVTVSLQDTISEYAEVKILIGDVVNPPTVLPVGTAFIQSFAADGGVIDESWTMSTGAIESALLDVISVDGGDRRVAVVGATKRFLFQGFYVEGGDVIKFVDATTTSDVNCGSAVAGVSDVGGLDIVALDGADQANLRFMQSSADIQPFALCYKFGSNPFKLYRDFAFTVKEVTSLSVSAGDVGVAVANYAKTWTFHGRGLAAGDLVRWIDASAVQDALANGFSPDCLDTSTLALVTPTGSTLGLGEDTYTRGITVFNNAAFVFSATENAGKTFYLCYRFGNEPYTIYSTMAIEVKHVQSIQASLWGSDSVAVVDYPKTFSFVGEGLAVNDRLYFIEVGSAASCASSAVDYSQRLAHTIKDQPQTLLFLATTSDVLINFAQTAAGKQAMLCYQFASEPYQLYIDLQLEVKMVTSFTGTQGSPGLAVADVPEPLTFQGFGLARGDEVRWIHSAEEDCDAHVASLYEPNTLSSIDTLAVDATRTATFNFSSKQDDYRPILCYRFGMEKFKLYSKLDIKIATITAKTTLIGSREVAVVGARKVFTMYGTHLAEGDRISWTRDPLDTHCATPELLISNPATEDDEYVSYTTLSNSFAVALSAFSSGDRIYLCYGFGTEPYRVFLNLFLDVKSLTSMRTLRGANGVAVAGALKTFLFEGDGVETGDFAKFVPDTSPDCSPPGITQTNIQKEFDDTTEMAIYVYENIPGTTAGGFQFAADKQSAGLARVLCYRFGSEDFFYYGEFRIDVKTIWSLQQYYETASGQPNVAVVDELKLIAIDGVGVAAVDKVKWIDSDLAQTDQDCENLPAQGLFSRTINVFANRTMWYPFEFGSQGKPWKLCYKFDAEPFRLYSSITVTAKEITDLLDFAHQNLTMHGKVAVVNQPKSWKTVGSGVQEGDSVKFVPLSVTTSADCGPGEANTGGGSTLMSVVTTNGSLTFTGLFTAYPVSLSDHYHVCYRFQDEPFTYVHGLTIATYGIVSIDRVTILATATTPLQLTGFRLSNLDRLGWTTDKTPNGCRTVFGIADVSDAKALVTFANGYDSLFFCYSFDRQPFTLFTSIAISVVVADIWVPFSISIVAGQSVDLQVFGTFGLTASADQVAWVPSDAPSCSSSVMADYSAIIASSVTTTAASTTSIARAGSSVISVTFVPPSSTILTDALSTWKLCYKFGNVPDFIMFGDVLCDVLTIQRIDLIASKPTATGTTMTFQFSGVGQQDFDIAKWIDTSGSMNPSDADCDTLPAVGGSSTVSVISQMATYGFTTETPPMALCYKFKGQSTFKLFPNAPVNDITRTSKSASGGKSMVDLGLVSTPQFILNRDIATVSLKLNKDINDLPAGSAAEIAFKVDFTTVLSAALGIDTSRIKILELLAGSVIVKFQLLPSDNIADPLVNELVQDLYNQLQDPASALMIQPGIIAIADPVSALTSQIDEGSALVTASSSSASLSVRGYQRAGLFTFITNVLSITEKTSRLFVRVVRQQGSSDLVTLPFRLESPTKTATYGVDYRIVSPSVDLDAMFLIFEIGVVEKTIEIEVIDDVAREAHFEYFKLILGDPEAPQSALGALPEVVVRIYDYDDGLVHEQSSFPALTDRRFNLLGWSVVENGNAANGQLRVDSNGLFAIDQVVGPAEYDEKCDLASPTGACGFACEVGANLPSADSLTTSYRVLSLTGVGSSCTSTANPVTSFPNTAFTVSFWIRTNLKSREACILSYTTLDAPDSADDLMDQTIDFAICDPTNLQIALDALDIAPVNRGRRGSLSTFVDVSDGAWHFIAIQWTSIDGRIKVFDNGMLGFDGGPYRVGYELPPNGYFVVGQLAISCTNSLDVTAPPAACSFAPNRGLAADVQHVNVWSRVLSRSELLKQLQWPIKIVTNGLILGWNFNLLNLSTGIISDISTRGVQQKNHGFLACAPTSSACTTPGVLPSIAPGFPCGPVYRNIWHFAAPSSLIKALASSYGGRLQFRMLSPSHNGIQRPSRGQLALFDALGNHLSLSLGGFPLPGSSTWTYYSAVLREDFGWVEEPAGDPVSGAVFQNALVTATALWIRGDLWGPDDAGQGQEVVYLNDVKLFSR